MNDNSVLGVRCSKEGIFVGINLLAAFTHISKGDSVITGIALFSLSVLGASLMKGTSHQPKGLNKPCELIKEDPIPRMKRASLGLKAALLGKPSNVTSRYRDPYKEAPWEVEFRKKGRLATIEEGSNESTIKSEKNIMPTGSFSSFLFNYKPDPLLSKIAKFALSNPFASPGKVEEDLSSNECSSTSSEELSEGENITNTSGIKNKKRDAGHKLGGYEITSRMKGFVSAKVGELNRAVIASRTKR